MSEAVEASQSLAQVLDALGGAALPIDDVLFAVLPLMRQVAALHQAGRVAALGAGDVLQDAQGRLGLRRAEGTEPSYDLAAVRKVQPQPGSALNVIDELRVTHDADTGVEVESLQAQSGAEAISKPAYLVGFDAWELRLGHHDEITDIFLVGQILACLACGLDFADPDDVQRFARNHGNLFLLNRRLNPVLAGVIGEMTALNRHARATDLADLVRRLETWRDQPAGLDIDRVLGAADGAAPRRTAVLSHLRDRLFDLSRRNRLIYFRPSQASVNLTVASVPLVLRLESIKPDDLCVWGGAFAADVIAGKPVSLRRWLRFEDQPYLPGALDRLIQTARRDRSEFGFSHLRLVIAYLRWNNLKEAPDERIVSPLLWLPVELVKRKGVTDQYVLELSGDEAEFNPALRHHLRQLHDIRLPETVDLETVSLEQIHADLTAQIKASEPGVDLRLVTRPAIRLIHQKAVQRLQQFQRRRGRDALRGGQLARPDFSYDRDDYRPLGLALFEGQVRPSPLPMRSAVGARAAPSPMRMAPRSDTAEALTYDLPEDGGHKFAWDLDLTQVTLANFNYKKMSLVRDYNQLIDEPAPNPGFDRIFSIEPRAVETQPPAPIPIEDQWNVVPADGTQNAAVAVARSGRSFIIQGPPGTGKSQTITNLIADYAGRGKRVLFVCEKRAALDVVFHRLKQSGLDDLCCLIHDSQSDKKAFVGNLREGYEQWIGQADSFDANAQARSAAATVASEQLARIERFERLMTERSDALGASIRALMRRIMELPDADDAVGPAVRERLPDYAEWDSRRDLVGRLARLLRDRLGVQSLAEHPFSRLGAGLVGQPQAYAQTLAAIEACEAVLDGLDEAFEDERRSLSGALTLADALLMARTARDVAALGLADRLDLLDPTSGAARDLAAGVDDLARLTAARDTCAAATVHWRDKLSAQDTQAALDLARSQERSILRVLSPAWWRLSGELKRRYDLSRHAVRPRFSVLLGDLAAEQAAEAARAAAEQALKARYRITDVDAFVRAVADLTPVVRGAALKGLLATLHAAPQTAALDGATAESLERLQAVVLRDFRAPADQSLEDLAKWLRDLREALEDLPDLLPILQELHAAGPAFAGMIQDLPLAPARMEALVATESLARRLRSDPELAQFDGAALTLAARRVTRAQALGTERNAALVRATQHRKFLDNVRRSSLSIAQLDDAGRRFRKGYSTGRRELEHEFGKSMRYRSIRELAGGDSGAVINDLKPIWLMSPLSVSDTLPLAADLFDVVIFDEASQIPMEEAVPALSRARQVIVVGDEMQLPPTSFFSAAPDEDETTVVAEEGGDRIAITLDADSLLNQAARNLPATLLAWHYRSRYEALISFSNAAFYEGRLITIPDRQIDDTGAAVAPTGSQDEAAARLGVDNLLSRALSFHAVQDGVYLSRANAPEARYIARLVRELLARETGMSVGVVAFSEAQQGEIEAALDALAAEDPAFSARLEAEYVREDEGHFNGLFVKNLENVQGDERDVIILSVCYAPGPDGRMLMNFGPINQRGGEKRLNVIFSRAKQRMALVSTIRAEAITNTHNDGAAAFKAFLQFAEASARGEAEQSQAVLAGLNPGARRAFAAAPPADPLRTALAAALRARGHDVREHVGRSQFRCDLAIAGPGGFMLAILLDPPATAEPLAPPRERYVFRPDILRRFGWPVMEVLSADWLRDPAGVLARIEARLADDDADEEDDLHDPVIAALEARPVAAWPPAQADDHAPTAMPLAALPPGMREFRFRQGSSNKFWRIGAEGLDVTVMFGRVGTKGQAVVKTYESPARVRREVNKLIDEKLRKGYEEVEVSLQGK
ncbi:AAA domain-containing protein [Caulobacter sp. KR2-114]|uniref:AAA domain-containing protein n=1 Tax=Caulobacter sp. KR2-114 TaxID=3400912 RepID=UPI003C0A069C